MGESGEGKRRREAKRRKGEAHEEEGKVMGNIPIKEAIPPTMRADTILWWNTEITTGMNNETSICGITTNIFKTPAESTLISRQAGEEEEVGREQRKKGREEKKGRQTHV